MSNGPDGGLRLLLRRRLPGAAQWVSIETGNTEQGVPDLNVIFRDGVEAWIECKRTDGWTPRFKPAQVGWLHARWRHGGRAVVVTHRYCAAGPRRAAADELYVTSAEHVRELRSGGLRAVPHLCHCEGGERRWDWMAVADAVHGGGQS